MEQCKWPKGCTAGVFAYITENDYEYGYCGYHFLEWLSNLPWRPDEVEDATFLVNDRKARHHRFEWTGPLHRKDKQCHCSRQEQMMQDSWK